MISPLVGRSSSLPSYGLQSVCPDMQVKFDAVEGDFLAAQHRLEELDRESLLLSKVVNAMQGRFRALPSSESESIISRLEGLTGRFRELEKESFYCRIYQAFAVVMSHYERGSSWRS